MSRADLSRADLKTLIETMVKAVVDYEDEVVIDEVAGRHNLIFEVWVDQRDVGHAVGQQGKNADAMRDILYAAAKRANIKCYLEIDDKARRKRDGGP